MAVTVKPNKQQRKQAKRERVLTADELRVLVSRAWRGKMGAVEAVREQRRKPYDS